jgi:hypothetical protein
LESDSKPARPTPQQAERERARLPVRISWRWLQLRLRFVLVLLVAFVIVGQWETLSNYFDRVLRWLTPSSVRELAVSPDTEYFCPMCPGVLSNWPEKCPVCNMPLVRRKRGEAPLLPEGVIARMQFSPYRIQLAGIRTTPVEYRSLIYELRTLGQADVNSPREPTDGPGTYVDTLVHESELAWVSVGQQTEILAEGPRHWDGRVAQIEPRIGSPSRSARLRIAVESGTGNLVDGALVSLRLRIPMADVEPFRSLPRDPPPPTPAEAREVFICPEHPDVLRVAPGNCPRDKLPLESQPLRDHQRLRWWCPMHPEVTASEDGKVCEPCQGMKLLPRIVAFAPTGQVLAIPDSAVIDDGRRQVAYVETAAGMYDGVEIVVGPRCQGFVPVLKGLEAGQRVVTSGAFLVDAESRLNPSLAGNYFGAGPLSADVGRQERDEK